MQNQGVDKKGEQMLYRQKNGKCLLGRRFGN